MSAAYCKGQLVEVNLTSGFPGAAPDWQPATVTGDTTTGGWTPAEHIRLDGTRMDRAPGWAADEIRPATDSGIGFRRAGVTVPINLDARAWALVCCLISAHSRRPIMSPFDTEALAAIGIEVERQLETLCREAQP